MSSRRCSILAVAGLFAALLSGCGSSSTTIPATTTVFYAHTAVLRNYSALATGYNAFGQLGNGNKDTQTSLVHVVGLGRVGGIATGADHTVAFANQTSVYAWGSNYHGQIGPNRDTSGVNAYSSTPVEVPLHKGTIKAIAAGEFHNLVVAGDTNAVYAWGYNGYGALGNGTFTDSTNPVQVLLSGGLQPLYGVAQVAAGGIHSLARTTDGRVYSWGDNTYGQLGHDPNTPLQIYTNSAELVSLDGAPLSNVTAIAAGGGTSYALQDYVDPVTSTASQRLLGWGYNGGSQLGPIVDTSKPYAVTPVVVATFAPNTVKNIAAGLDHLVVLKYDGSVWAIGFNRFAQLGNNDKNTADSSVLVQVVGPDGKTPLMGATEIMAAGYQSFALAPNQTNPDPSLFWYGWGDNSYGQLGNSISTTSIGYLLLPTLVRGF